MRAPSIRRTRRGGALLDLVLGAAILILAAFVLYSFGLNFSEILEGAARFFGA
jgi:hypothetical protein